MEGVLDESDGVGSDGRAETLVTISVDATNNIASQVAIAIRALGSFTTTEKSADSLRILALDVGPGARLQGSTAGWFEQWTRKLTFTDCSFILKRFDGTGSRDGTP